MRLMLVAPMPPDRTGTGAIPALLHAEMVGLLERHDVTLVTIAGPEAREIDAVARLRAEGIDIRPVVRRTGPDGTLGWRRRLRMVGSFTAGGVPQRTAWFAEPAVGRAIAERTARAPVDAVIVEDNAMGTVRLPAGVPAILTEHEVRRPRPRAPLARRATAWPAWALDEVDRRRWPGYQRRVWSRFDLVQVFTPQDAEAVADLAPHLRPRVRVNPFPIEVPHRSEGAEDPDVILFAGNFTHPPNVDAAVWLATDIMDRIVARRPSTRLRIVGPYAPAEVHALSGPGVEVVGEVPDLSTELRNAAVLLAPVRTGGGMRMKVLHALATARPVITTPLGASGVDLGGACPPLATADDSQALADATLRLLGDVAARRRLADAGHAYVLRHHSPAAYVDRLEAVIDEAIARRLGLADAHGWRG